MPIRKLSLLVLGMLMLVNVAPVFAQITLETVAGATTTNRGLVKGIKTTGGGTSVANDTAVLSLASLTPDAQMPVLIITGTTDTGTNPVRGSMTTDTGTASAKTGAIKIEWTGTNGAQQSGWLRIYADGD